MKKLLVLAIILRILVAAFYFHPDIKTYNFQASFLKKGIFNIYSYLDSNRKSLPIKDEFVYFPLTYFVLGGYQALVSGFLGKNFDVWLSDASSSFVRDPSTFTYLSVLKLPYLILDILIAFLLMKFFKDPQRAKEAFVIWLFNPFTIILIYIFSNIDIIPVSLTIVSLLLVKKNKLLFSSLALGLAAGFKLYPLVFVPFLFLKGKDLKEKISIACISLGVFTLISLPFSSPAFIRSALVSSLTTRIFNPGITIGFGESLIPALMTISALFFYRYLIERERNLDLFKYWTALLLLIFSLSHFHVQWLLWAAPFIVVLAVKRKELSLSLFFLSTLAFIIPVLYEDRSMTVGLFRVYSTLYDLLPTPFSVIQRFYDPYNLQGILHSVLAAGSLVVVHKIFLRKEIT